MNRRELLRLTGAASVMALGRIAPALAQQGMKRLAFVNSIAASDTAIPPFVTAMKDGLASQGWVEGKNIVIDVRYGIDAPDKAAPVIDELLGLKPDVFILVGNNAAAELAKRNNSTPVIVAPVTDAGLAALVPNFAHPPGNITGFTGSDPGSIGKQIQLLKELAPSVARVGSLYYPNDPQVTQATLDDFMAAATSLSMESVVLRVESPSAIDPTISNFAATPNGGFAYSIAGSFSLNNHALVTAALIKYRIPHVLGHLVFGSDGIVNYYVDTFDIERRAGTYAGLILNGTPISALPVQAPTKYTLIVNQKIAAQMGITVPQGILIRADRVVS